jgi:hypothetical protein
MEVDGPLLWLITAVKIFFLTLTASSDLDAAQQPCLWPDEVKFGLATSTTSKCHIMCSAVNVTSALLDVWPIMAGYSGM